jgi:quercetin dioxygenase-like cupin family protein
LSKHKANEPITVFCLAGSGTFRAGKDLEDRQKLVAGTLITLEPEIEHEVAAEPAIHILVTKFKND